MYLFVPSHFEPVCLYCGSPIICLYYSTALSSKSITGDGLDNCNVFYFPLYASSYILYV